MDKLFYCVICGTIISENRDICPHCRNFVTPKESLHERQYYREKSMLLVGNYSYTNQILIDEEASQNSEFNPNTTTHNAEKELNRRITCSGYDIHKNNKPKCPTCGSTNIKKISATSKMLGAAMWGLFSKTAHSQFQCNNCGYKW